MVDILQRIAQGKNSAVEFKNAAVTPDDLARKMTAFANAQGGAILIGVDDNGSISGVDRSKRDEEWVANIARDSVIPPLNLKIQVIKAGEKKILYIEIPKGKNKPYQTNKDKFYVRVGSTNRSPSQAELMRLYQRGGVFHFDITGVEHTAIRDLNFSKIAAYFDRYEVDFSAESDKERLLRNVDILTENNETTVAGLLLFGIYPQKYLHNASCSFAHFGGDTLDSSLLNQQVVEGNLDQQVDTMLALIKNSLPNGSTIEGAKTIPTRV